MDPSALKYAKSHEWVHVDGDTATVGISDFAVRELTDLVFIDLPAVGARFAVGDSFGEVESVKAVSDLYAPLAGEVIEVNGEIEGDLNLLSQDAYGKGWLIKMRIGDAADLSGLFDKSAYDAHCAAES